MLGADIKLKRVKKQLENKELGYQSEKYKSD